MRNSGLKFLIEDGEAFDEICFKSWGNTVSIINKYNTVKIRKMSLQLFIVYLP